MKQYKFTKDYTHKFSLMCIIAPCPSRETPFKEGDVISGNIVDGNVLYEKTLSTGSSPLVLELKIPLSVLEEVSESNTATNNSTTKATSSNSMKILGVAVLVIAGYVIWKKKLIKFR